MPTKKINTILGIDTSCDDTSAAITFQDRVISNVVSSQIEMHKKWGGTVPGLARREHEARIENVVKEAIKQAIKNLKQAKSLKLKALSNLHLDEVDISREDLIKEAFDHIDAIAVTYGPGLAIALEVGIKYAKTLALKYNKPLLAVDHMEGHLLSSLAKNIKGRNKIQTEEIFPSLGILVSGGHTELLYVKEIGNYELIGQTLDDAFGEAFDKVARILDLGYPGGPIISEFAKQGDPLKYNLPIAMKGSKDFNISYSGLKTAVMYLVRDLKGEDRVQVKMHKESWEPQKSAPSIRSTPSLPSQVIYDIAASFQTAAIGTLSHKVKKALETYDVKSILLGGGAVNNVKLRERLYQISKDVNIKKEKQMQVYFPYSSKLFQDNAAMIAIAGYLSNVLEQRRVYVNPQEIESIDRNPQARLYDV